MRLTDSYAVYVGLSVRKYRSEWEVESILWALPAVIATEHGEALREAQKEQSSGRDPAFMAFSPTRNPIGKGSFLATQNPRMDEDSNLEELLAHEEDTRMFEARDDTLGAIS